MKKWYYVKIMDGNLLKIYMSLNILMDLVIVNKLYAPDMFIAIKCLHCGYIKELFIKFYNEAHFRVIN